MGGSWTAESNQEIYDTETILEDLIQTLLSHFWCMGMSPILLGISPLTAGIKRNTGGATLPTKS